MAREAAICRGGRHSGARTSQSPASSSIDSSSLYLMDNASVALLSTPVSPTGFPRDHGLGSPALLFLLFTFVVSSASVMVGAFSPPFNALGPGGGLTGTRGAADAARD